MRPRNLATPRNGCVTGFRQRQPDSARTHAGGNAVTISEQQLGFLRSEIQLLEAELTLTQQELDTWKRRGEQERNLYNWMADCMVDPGQSRHPLKMFREAHKAHYDAAAELKDVHIAKLRSQVAIKRAMLEEADKKIAHPGDRALIA
jgi:hypothetical protein